MKKSKVILVVGIIATLAVVELCCGALIVAAHKYTGTPKRLSVFRFHPLLTGQNIHNYESNWSETYPVFGYVNRIFVSSECGYTTDKYGFIHNGNPNRTIDPKKPTIFILGGSTVAGHGSSCNDTTIAAQLEQLLRADHPDVQVINAGVAGYYSPLEFMRIAHEIMFYNPEVVIAIGGTNDFEYAYEPFRNRTHTYYISPYQKSLSRTLDDTTSLFWSVKNLVYNLTRFTEYTYTRFVLEKGIGYLTGHTRSSSKSGLIANIKTMVGTDKAPPADFQYTDDQFQSGLDEKMEHYTMYIKESKALVNGMGKKYYYVLQPILFTETRALPAVEQQGRDIARYAIYKKRHIDVVKRADYFWGHMDQTLKASGIPYLNLVNVFPDGAEIYSDYVHYTDQGNALIAQKLYTMLTKDKANAF